MDRKSPGVVVIEGHVQGLANARSLGEAGIPVYVVDENDCIAHYSKYCSRFLRCPDYKSDCFAEFLINLAIKDELDGWLLLPSNDHAVLTLAKHKSGLEEYYRLVTPSLDVVSNIYDKSRLLNTAKESGIPFPETYYFDSVKDINLRGLKYPVITKGRCGLDFYKLTGKKAFIARNSTELSRQLELISGYIDMQKTFTQEVIPGDGSNRTISFACFCVDGIIKTYWMGEKLREHPLQFGTATFSRCVLIEDLLVTSSKLMKSLNYSGICEIEYLKDPRDKVYKLIEINARTWLWVGLARTSGVDFIRIVYNYVNNLEFAYPSKYNTDIKWSNYLTDIAYSLKAIVTGKLSFMDFLKSYRGSVVHAVFNKRDPWPALMYFLFLFRFLKNR